MTIEIEVKLDQKSLNRFLLYHYYTQVSGIISVLLSIGALVGLLVRWSAWLPMQRVILILIALMFTVLQPLMLMWRGKKQLMTETFQIPFHYVFGEDKLRISQEEASQEFTWDDVRKIKWRKDAIYVYMSNVSAFVLPEEQCGGQFQELVKFTKEKMAG